MSAKRGVFFTLYRTSLLVVISTFDVISQFLYYPGVSEPVAWYLNLKYSVSNPVAGNI